MSNTDYGVAYQRYNPFTSGVNKPVWLGGNTASTGVRINTNTLDFKNFLQMSLNDANSVINQPITLTFGMHDIDHNIMAWTGVSSIVSAYLVVTLSRLGV
jgi:hypothetical protein